MFFASKKIRKQHAIEFSPPCYLVYCNRRCKLLLVKPYLITKALKEKASKTRARGENVYC